MRYGKVVDQYEDWHEPRFNANKHGDVVYELLTELLKHELDLLRVYDQRDVDPRYREYIRKELEILTRRKRLNVLLPKLAKAIVRLGLADDLEGYDGEPMADTLEAVALAHEMENS